jgi:membrane protein DedA with SNARE-associated domain
MAHEVSMLFAQYGLLLVFVSVFVDQVGAPVPSLPTLVVAGALSATGELLLPGIFWRRWSHASSAISRGTGPGGTSAVQ